MDNTIFTLNNSGTVLFHPELMNLLPELSILSDEEKLFLVLAYDNETPFRFLPQSDRILKAQLRAFGKIDNKLIERTAMRNAINVYEGISYSPKRESMRVYEKKLRMLDSEIAGDVSTKDLQKLLESQKMIRVAMAELQDELQQQAEIKNSIRGGGALSFIEDVMKNKSDYDRIKHKQKV